MHTWVACLRDRSYARLSLPNFSPKALRDLVTVKASVLYEYLVSAVARNNNAGKINSRHIAFQGFADRTMAAGLSP